MLRLTLLSAALLQGVYGAAHACPEGRTNVVDGVCPTGFYEDLANAVDVATTAAPVVTEAPAAPVTQAPATQAPATQAPTTAAPTTAAPTTAAPAGNATGNSSRVLFEEFNLPIVRKLAAHKTCICAVDPNAGNNTNGTVEEQVVTTAITLTMDLDISGMDQGQKTAAGNSIAYGIHATACNGLGSEYWSSLGRCMMGISSQPGISFDMAMGIDTQLVGENYDGGCSPAQAAANNCYGDAPPARRLAAVTLTNKADFSVKAKSTNAAALVAKAKDQMTSDASKALLETPTAILAEVTKALARPSMVASLGSNFTSAIVEAVKTAKVTAATNIVVAGGSAPASSNAYTAAVSGVFMIVVGALLM